MILQLFLEFNRNHEFLYSKKAGTIIIIVLNDTGLSVCIYFTISTEPKKEKFV